MTTKHGTASVDGSYVEFQAAVLRALPREIDRKVALKLTRNGELLACILRDALVPQTGIFTISCEGLYTASELVIKGNYNWWNHWITDELFPLKKHTPMSRKIEFVSFNYDPASGEVLSMFRSQGLEPPTYEDALYFGIQHPEEIEKHPIIFLHEPVIRSDGYRYVLKLRGGGGKALDLVLFDRAWDSFFAFAAVHPSIN